jgi:hypothetical protein
MDNDLYLKPEKCLFDQDRLEFLGLILSADGVQPDTVKVDGIAEWPIPSNLKEVRSYLGFVGYYRIFIPSFAEIARPLFNLTKKGVKFNWDHECQQAFDKLKEAIMSYPVLRLPDPTLLYRVECDASNYATGAILSQLDENGIWHLVSFKSKAMTLAKQNYDIFDKELLAVIHALSTW